MIMKKPSLLPIEVVSISDDSLKLTAQKELLWPSIEYGSEGVKAFASNKFPGESYIRDRFKKTQNVSNHAAVFALKPFTDTVRVARERLWVFDLYFDAVGVAGILEAVKISHVKYVRILSGKKDVHIEFQHLWLEQLKNARNDKRDRSRKAGDIEWKTALDSDRYPYPHDRFAIVDQELWHFGATVGGGHPSLNAASRGWDAHTTDAVKFFEYVWKIVK